MIKGKTREEILNTIAPCSMICTTCTGCKYGQISEHAKELLHLFEGHEEFLERNLKPEYRHKLEEFRVFQDKLKKYALPKCGGCRNQRSNRCSIHGCLIPDCVKEHGIDFCSECQLFPCDKVNEQIYKSTTIERWLKGNQEMREHGIEKYYEENKDKPHYSNYVKGDGMYDLDITKS